MENSPVTKEHKFILIGAGLPRTGTRSLKSALEIILPGKCHHIVDAMKFHVQEWRDIINGKMTDEEFKTLLSTNYSAALDSPFCFQYQRAMQLFPDAKVLLSVRDNPQNWVKSVKATILDAFDFPLPFRVFSFLGLFTSYIGERPTVFINAFTSSKFHINMKKEFGAGRGVKYYTDWVQDVESHVPKEKLLKFNVKEGWEPLCKFLDVPVPNVPFPNVNTTAEFQNRENVRRNRSWLLLYEVISIPFLIYLSLYRS